LSFKWKVGVQRFHGLRKIHLNNSVEDPSCLSEWLGSGIFRSANIPAARVAHAIVELNGRKLGLYVIKEAFTDDFLALHFPDKRSRLYEPGPGHDVNEPLDEKAETGWPDRSALDALTAAAFTTDLNVRWRRFQQTLDVERFLSFMALEIMLGHRDGYCLARNNFRVAQEGKSGRTVFVPHGMDQLFGSSPPIIEPRMSGLVGRTFLETTQGRSAYRPRFGDLLTNAFKPEVLIRQVETLSEQLLPDVPVPEKDSFREGVAELKLRIARRHLAMLRQFEQLQSPMFSAEGTAILRGWRRFGEPVEGAMRQTRAEDDRMLLHIQAGPGTAASWRSTARLPAGRYRFEGSVRTADVKPLSFGNSQGAVLRLWRPTSARSAAASYDSANEMLRLEFELSQESEIELGCELRASAGDAWFDTSSLRVLPLPPR
jgi:hypothetical protein